MYLKFLDLFALQLSFKTPSTGFWTGQKRMDSHFLNENNSYSFLPYTKLWAPHSSIPRRSPHHRINHCQIFGPNVRPDTHLEALYRRPKKTCFTRLNIMKKLSHSPYDADITTLLRICRSTIRAKCDFGAAAYSSATKTLPTSFNMVHHSALRLACGAFHTTPSSNLYVLCNELPPDLHRQLVFSRSIVRIRNLERTLVSLSADPNIHRPYVRLSLTSHLRAAAEQLQLDVDDINKLHMPTSISAVMISS